MKHEKVGLLHLFGFCVTTLRRGENIPHVECCAENSASRPLWLDRSSSWKPIGMLRGGVCGDDIIEVPVLVIIILNVR